MQPAYWQRGRMIYDLMKFLNGQNEILAYFVDIEDDKKYCYELLGIFWI